MNIKFLRILMVLSLMFLPTFTEAGKKGKKTHESSSSHHHKHKHKHHSKRHNETRVVADDGHITDTPTATEDDEVSGTGSHENSDDDSAEDTLKVDEELLAALEAVKAAKEKKKKREKKKKEKLILDDDEDEEFEDDDASESEENGFVNFVKSPEFKDGAKQTVGCCAGFGFKIFKNIRKEQEKLEKGEKLDAGAIIAAVIEAAADSLEGKGLLDAETPRSKRASKSRRMVLNANHGGARVREKHAVTLTITQYDEAGDPIDVHDRVFKVGSEEEEVIAADSIYLSTLEAIGAEKDMHGEVEVKVAKQRGVRGRRSVQQEEIASKPAIKICVHYQNAGKRYRKTCMISTLGTQSHNRDVTDAVLEIDEDEYDPDVAMSLVPRRDRDSRLREIMDDDNDDVESAPALPAKAKKKVKIKSKKKKSHRSSHSRSRSHSHSHGGSTRD